MENQENKKLNEEVKNSIEEEGFEEKDASIDEIENAPE